jgi:hypothetical protein
VQVGKGSNEAVIGQTVSGHLVMGVTQTEHCELGFLLSTIKIGTEDVYSFCVTGATFPASGDQRHFL